MTVTEKTMPPKLVLGKLWRTLTTSLTAALIVFPRSLKPASGKKPHELHPTAYLDALRGYAAWIVYNYHCVNTHWRPTEWEKSSVVLLFFKGSAMVDIFFVISGFALTYGVLGHMHNNRPDKVMDSLASSVFRRYFRLYLPLIFASFVAMVCIYTGLAMPNSTRELPILTSFRGYLWFWITDTVASWDPFAHIYPWIAKESHQRCSAYLPQAWTIPVEFQGSLIIYMFCVGVCKLTPRARMMVTLCATAVSIWFMATHIALFLFGMWLADCRNFRNRQQKDAPLQLPLAVQPTLDPTNPQVPNERVWQEDDKHRDAKGSLLELEKSVAFPKDSGMRSLVGRLSRNNHTGEPTLLQQLPYLVFLALSIPLLTAPTTMKPDMAWPINWMSHTYPPGYVKIHGARKHWPSMVGAMLMCWALEHLPLIQRLLAKPFSQCIGELSFGIYIMHYLVRWVVWRRYLEVWTVRYIGNTPRSVIPAYIVQTIILFWAAEAFRRVDNRCVGWTKRLQELLFKKG